jgi:enterobacteria phage integrase
MGRPKSNTLPRYLSFRQPNETYYYRNPSMARKANLGRDAEKAIQTALSLNGRHAIESERTATRLELTADFGAPTFAHAFGAFVEKYCTDYRLKTSTRARLAQRTSRMISRIGGVQLPLITTQLLREAIEEDSPFEQAKLKTILARFLRFAKSCGAYPQQLPNPVDDLYVDPAPGKRRQRMTLEQFRAIYGVAPEWLRTMMVLGLHLALRRVDLVNLRFEDVHGDRIVSPIRKTDTEARAVEATSVSFPIHADVRRAIALARESSIRAGRCPFIVHRQPRRQTRRQKNALAAGRMQHPAQVLPEYASKTFAKARAKAMQSSEWFEGIVAAQLPTLHEIRSLSSHLYARSGYQTQAVQDLMAHTDPDMTRAYQRGHGRKILQVEMMLPCGIVGRNGRDGEEPSVQEPRVTYGLIAEKKFSQDFLSARLSVPNGLI